MKTIDHTPARRISGTTLLVTTSLLTAVVTVATMFFKIPIAVGYIHLGDAMVLLAAIILPRRYAFFAAGVGAGLADVLGGYAVWAPWTFVIKIAMVLIMTVLFRRLIAARENGASTHKILGVPALEWFGYLLSILWTAAAYYVAEGFLYGNWQAPMAGVPFNLLQAAVGAVLAVLVSGSLYRTQLGREFSYRR